MRIDLACPDLYETFIFNDVGGQMAAVDASSVDSDRAGAVESTGARRVSVNDEGLPSPAVGPGRSIGGVRTFRRTALFVDYLNGRDGVDVLMFPGYPRKKATVDEDSISLFVVNGLLHGFKVGPIFIA